MSNQIVKADAKDIRALLNSDKVKLEIAKVLPKHITPERMTRVALTAFLKTPALLQCTQESLFDSILRCAQAGLEPDGRLAHLIPYGKVCQVIFDWKGLVVLALRNNYTVYPEVVFSNDEFDAWNEDGVRKLRHRIDWRKPRGEPILYYCTAVRGGILDYEIMPTDECDAIRARSRAGKSGPWVTDTNEMRKKCPIRRMSKRWDLLPEIAAAINADDDTPEPFQAVVTSKPIFETKPKEEAPPAPEQPTEAEAPQADAPAGEPVFETAQQGEPENVNVLRAKLAAQAVDEKKFLGFLYIQGITETAHESLEAMRDADPYAYLMVENRCEAFVNQMKGKGQK